MAAAPGVELTARGKDLPALFVDAARGLGALLVDAETVSAGGLRDRVLAEGQGREALLSNWLGQVLYLYRRQGEVLSRFHIRRLTDTAVEAEAEGELFDPGRHAVKVSVKSIGPARVVETSEGWTATAVLEV